MKNPIDQLIKSANNVRLSGEASARIRERLVAHMRAHPISHKPVISPYNSFIGRVSPLLYFLRTPVVAFAIFLLVVAGGATSYAASRALPGNPLYDLKVNVIEPIQGLFAVSPEAKAQWRASLVEKRVNEVEQLVAQEKLTPEEGTKSQERFDRSSGDARESIQQLAKHDSDAASRIKDAFTSSLDFHGDALEKTAGNASSSSSEEARIFARHIKDEANVTRTETSTTTDISPEASTIINISSEESLEPVHQIESKKNQKEESKKIEIDLHNER